MVTQSGILERVIDPKRGNMAAGVAQYILSLDFPPPDHERYHELATKAQDGALSPQEQSELDDYLNINALLMILQSKARLSLLHNNSAA